MELLGSPSTWHLCLTGPAGVAGRWVDHIRMGPENLPRMEEISLDFTVLAFTLGTPAPAPRRTATQPPQASWNTWRGNPAASERAKGTEAEHTAVEAQEDHHGDAHLTPAAGQRWSPPRFQP